MLGGFQGSVEWGLVVFDHGEAPSDRVFGSHFRCMAERVIEGRIGIALDEDVPSIEHGLTVFACQVGMTDRSVEPSDGSGRVGNGAWGDGDIEGAGE